MKRETMPKRKVRPSRPTVKPRPRAKDSAMKLKEYRNLYAGRLKAMRGGRASYSKWYAANHSRSQALAKELKEGLSGREWGKVERGLESMRERKTGLPNARKKVKKILKKGERASRKARVKGRPSMRQTYRLR